jgi:tetratricopeptide (TPR) repeat protein
MAIDKNKIEKNAIKFLQKGQLKKAATEFQKLLAIDPKDMRTRAKMVDIYAKLGKKEEAIEECRRISDSYLEKGFVVRAIAMWKQALRLDKTNAENFKAMAELYLQQKLIGDAIAAFKAAVDLLRKDDRTAEAGELLTRMESLAPNNLAIKVHLAEVYLEEERIDEFGAILEKVVVQLRGEGHARKLLKLMESLYDKSNRHLEMVKPLARQYLDLGEDEKALAVIQQGIAANPQDRDLRLYTIRANLSLGNLSDARKVALSIHEEDPQDLFILEQLAAISQARGDDEELVQWYKELASIYGKKGLTSQEELYYRKVSELCPDDAEALLAVGGPGGAIPSPEPIVEPIAAAEDDELLMDLGDFDSVADSIGGAAPITTLDAAANAESGVLEADLYLKYGLEDKARAKLEELREGDPDNITVLQKLRDLYWRQSDRESWVAEQLNIASILGGKQRELEAQRVYEAIIEVFPDHAQAVEGLKTLDRSKEGHQERIDALEQQLVGVDELISGGQEQEAINLLTKLMETQGEYGPIMERLERLGWTPPATLRQGEDLSRPKFELGELDFNMAGSIAGFEDVEISELDDIVQEFKSGVAEKLDDGDFNTHYDLGIAYKEMGLLDEALNEFQNASRHTEKAKDAYTSMAMVYQETGQLSDARAALRLALAVPSNDAQDRVAILYEIGVINEQEKDFEGALVSFEKAAAIDPGHRDVMQRVESARKYSGG